MSIYHGIHQYEFFKNSHLLTKTIALLNLTKLIIYHIAHIF